MAAPLEFRILGPLEVWESDRQLRLGGTKQRSIPPLLLLKTGSVVSSDRLIEELWADDPPEDASTALQQHVSRLRKLLESHAVLLTQAPGYVLEVDPDQLDLARFERLQKDGRRLLDEGRAGEAASVLRRALAVWRGEPLADLPGERFVSDARTHLEEAHLEVLEARIEADLASGRHRELVAELSELVRTHPHRERFCGQLMLALYRSGRQAEALDAYADSRRRLLGELGLEPGPELQRLQQAILAHDAGLDGPHRSARARRRRRAVAAVTAGAVLLASLTTALALRRDEGANPSFIVRPGEGAVVALDARTGAVRRRVSAGRTPSAIAASEGVIWVVDADARTVLRLAQSSRVVETLSTGATPTDVVATGGSVWVAHGRPLKRAQFVGPVATGIARLDASTGTKRADVRLPMEDGALSNLVENHVAVHGGAVWAVTPDFTVVRIEASTGAVTAESRAIQAAAVAAGPAGVWVLGVDGAVAKLDENTAKPVTRIRVPTSSVGSIAVGTDAAWVTAPSDGTLWKIGAGARPDLGAIELSRGISDVAAANGWVWVANPIAGTVVKVNVASADVERTIDLGGIPRSLVLEDDTLWIALVSEPAASTIEVAGVRPFPASGCEPVLAGEEESDLLVVSDLPLQGGVRVTTTQMVQAIAFVLREHDFRAGRFRVAYQSCDDSVARTGLFDEAKCAANARAYADNPDVIGVIGTLNSPCSEAALPQVNRAPDGPLAMVSPFNSFVGLTRRGPGVDPSLPAALYPTGRRNFVRVYPTDDLQGAALALFARDRAARRVFVLDDGDPGYGGLMATAFETAAHRLGLTVVGRMSWDPRAGGYSRLADEIARVRPDAVFIGGLLDTNAGAVVRDLRARLGRQVDLLAPDGVTPLTLLTKRAGKAALGVYVTLPGAVIDHLPATGERFVERFGETQPGVSIEPAAV